MELSLAGERTRSRMILTIVAAASTWSSSKKLRTWFPYLMYEINRSYLGEETSFSSGLRLLDSGLNTSVTFNSITLYPQDSKYSVKLRRQVPKSTPIGATNPTNSSGEFIRSNGVTTDSLQRNTLV